MPAYPGLPIPQFHTFMAHEDASRHGKYAPGTTFQIASYELGGNTGTYVDAPFHRHPSGPDLPMFLSTISRTLRAFWSRHHKMEPSGLKFLRT